MIKAVAVHCHDDTPNEINSSGLAEPQRLNNKLRACWQMVMRLVDLVVGVPMLRRGVRPVEKKAACWL
jgi:hypothetical protein